MEYSIKEALLSICCEAGTPVYAYDINTIKSKIGLLRRSLPEKVKIFYSMKANPNLGIVSFINRYADGMEVSSEGEIFTALEAGANPEGIIFSGPGKTPGEIAYAIEKSIGCIVAESERELDIIDKAAARKGKKAVVMLRINPARESAGAKIKMGGMSKQFGIDEELAPSVFDRLQNLNYIEAAGIQIYMGTQILDDVTVIKNIGCAFEIARKITGCSGIKVKMLDLGGGFGIPYFKGEKPLNMHALGEGTRDMFERNIPFFDFKETKIIVESGRYIIADSGYFMTRVLYKKYSRGKAYLVVDSGSNFHSAAAGIGRFVRNNFPVEVLTGPEGRDMEAVDIVGPLCTPTDVLAQNIALPVCEEGDIVVFPQSGAYGLSSSMTGFLSHPGPAEVMFDGGNFHVVRERGSREDFIEKQRTYPR